ncbi:hypothetical protein H6F94_06575 [Leptolyngbya sp. FACHB-261]|nr:hypothetical protein [Leptolyngbya sp. FACHB-261]
MKATQDDDIILGYAGNDILIGREGNDLINSGVGHDCAEGSEGDDSVSGDDGDDYLDGGPGNDHLYGRDGDDALIGGPGNDRLSGGLGSDLYVYAPGDGTDVIENEAGPDVLRLQGILSHEVTIKPATGGRLLVFHAGKLIVKMQGIKHIWTEDGCFDTSRWLGYPAQH